MAALEGTDVAPDGMRTPVEPRIGAAWGISSNPRTSRPCAAHAAFHVSNRARVGADSTFDKVKGTNRPPIVYDSGWK
jgi:hypothetical protein